jgi:hypothetical protein
MAISRKLRAVNISGYQAKWVFLKTRLLTGTSEQKALKMPANWRELSLETVVERVQVCVFLHALARPHLQTATTQALSC